VLFLQVNFSEESLRENIGAFVNALLLAKPVGLKKSKWSAGHAYMLIYK
jgi:ribosomal protein L1